MHNELTEDNFLSRIYTVIGVPQRDLRENLEFQQPRIRPFFKNVPKDCQRGFKDSKCLLTISVGQSTHEGELFSTTMDLINNSFASCVLLVDDSLQRHTMS